MRMWCLDYRLILSPGGGSSPTRSSTLELTSVHSCRWLTAGQNCRADIIMDNKKQIEKNIRQTPVLLKYTDLVGLPWRSSDEQQKSWPHWKRCSPFSPAISPPQLLKSCRSSPLPRQEKGVKRNSYCAAPWLLWLPQFSRAPYGKGRKVEMQREGLDTVNPISTYEGGIFVRVRC